MADNNVMQKIRHRGRLEQVRIYLGKFLRMFVYQNDWKVFPMAFVVAALVSMVVRKDLFLTMEGTLKGAFALTCVCIWNGCFNSIQVISREREIIKREHRSGMHITSYIASHMIYQAMICIAQVLLTIFACTKMGIQFPKEGLVSSNFKVELFVTLFLITFASDMMSLFISAVARSTTTAMTVMPFILIFQLVFSGGFFTLPSWATALSKLTVSNYGLSAIAAQGNYNELPMATVWNAVSKLKDREIKAEISVATVMDFMTKKDNPLTAELRNKKISDAANVGQLYENIKNTESFKELMQKDVNLQVTLGEVLALLRDSKGFEKLRAQSVYIFDVGDVINLLAGVAESTGADQFKIGKVYKVSEIFDFIHIDDVVQAFADFQVSNDMTIGDVIDSIIGNSDISKYREKKVTIRTTLGKIMDAFGEERIKTMIETATASAAKRPAFERTEENIERNWYSLILFIMVFAVASTAVLEFVDKDKR